MSGAPVVSDSGELIANLSISDLRALTSEHFGVLALPVAEFLAVEHQTAYIGWAGRGGAGAEGGRRAGREDHNVSTRRGRGAGRLQLLPE